MTIKKYILLSISTLMLAGCTSEDISNAPSDERIPLRLEATLSSGCAVTRAVGNQFDEKDELLSYVRHVRPKDGGGYESVQASLVTFTKGAAAMTDVEGKENVKQTSDLAPGEALYWDDFSESASEDTDLRTKDHGLQSYYGYCYNGGNPSTALVGATGVLGWTTDDDQSIGGDMKKNDLLWSKTQDLVTYDHAKDAHGTLTVPYTHAMSKFTIVLVAGDGFKAEDFSSTKVTLHGMNSEGAFTAPTPSVDVTGATLIDVEMFGNETSTTNDSKPCKAYEAVAVPKATLSSGKLHATINNLGGNNYKVYLSDEILKAWTSGVASVESESGVNYKLTVTLNKQTVNVVATLADWNSVSADGTGEIQFTADVTTIDKDNATSLANGDSFSLWMAKEGESYSDDATTTSVYNGTDKKFNNTPAIYWPNGLDNFYFRALAVKSATEGKTMDAVTDKSAAQGTDLLWGTTAEHKGNGTIDYAEGAAVNPRTGDVPLVFKHAMSNVIINLATTTDASQVVLTGAKVTLTNLATGGTINIATGEITPSTDKAEKALDKSTSFDNLYMIPQTITDDAKLIVELSDGTTYSLQLNKCLNGSTAITKWESGNKYTYTITLKKEEVQFRALVEKWTENTGSGNAILDWD